MTFFLYHKNRSSLPRMLAWLFLLTSVAQAETFEPEDGIIDFLGPEPWAATLELRISVDHASVTFEQALLNLPNFRFGTEVLERWNATYDLQGAYDALDALEQQVFHVALDLDKCDMAIDILVNQMGRLEPAVYYALFSRVNYSSLLFDSPFGHTDRIFRCLAKQDAAVRQHFLRSNGIQPPIFDDTYASGIPEHQTILYNYASDLGRGTNSVVDVTPFEAWSVAEAIALKQQINMSDMAALALLEFAYRESGDRWTTLPVEAENLHRLITAGLSEDERALAFELVERGIAPFLSYITEASALEELEDQRQREQAN